MGQRKRKQWEFDRWVFDGCVRKSTVQAILVLCALQEKLQWQALPAPATCRIEEQSADWRTKWQQVTVKDLYTANEVPEDTREAVPCGVTTALCSQISLSHS